MRVIPISKLKKNFSKVLQSIQNSGEKYIIEDGKKHKKVAMIVSYTKHFKESNERTFGLLEEKGSFVMKKDFSISDEEILAQ